MASFIVYANPEKIESITKWINNHLSFEEVPFHRDDIKLLSDVHTPKTHVPMMVNHHEYIIISDYIESFDAEVKNNVIDRKKILKEYLKRIGANPNAIYSPGSQAIDEVIQLAVDLIEENYRVIEIC